MGGERNMLFLHSPFFFKKKHQNKYTAKVFTPQVVYEVFLLYLYVDALEYMGDDITLPPSPP